MSTPDRISEPLRFFGRRFRPVRSRQRGQALTEVALSALLVLIPTFAIGWAMYAYGQARTSALNGARYAAWERTVWRDSASGPGSAGNIEKLMVERFFARPDAPIQSSGYTQATNTHLPSFYFVHNGDHVIDVENTDRTQDGRAARPTLTFEHKKTVTSTVGDLYSTITDAMSLAGASNMTLQERGLYVAEVGVKLNAIRHLKIFDELNLDIKQRAAVVTDGWSAGGLAHEAAVVRPFVPAAAIGGLLDPVFSFFRALGSNATPFSEFYPGCVAGDVVPRDSRVGGSNAVRLCRY